MTSRRRRPPNHSRAWVDALVCPVLVDAERVRTALPAGAGLQLRRLTAVGAGRHPVIVEVWRVHDGALQTAGLDAHDWSELTATAAGLGVGGGSGAMTGAGVGSVAGAAGGGALGMLLGPVGMAWGAAIGAAAGATTGAALGATAGAMWAARWAGGAARRASLAGSRVLGSYSEIIATIPCRRGADDVSYVVGMYTDSLLSRVGERTLGFGYRKQPAHISRDEEGNVSVEAHNGRGPGRLLQVTVSPREGNTTGQVLVAALGHPLVGVRARGRIAVSHLDRTFEAASVQISRAAVTLDAGPAFLDGLIAGRHRIAASGPRTPWGALAASGLPVHLSYPRSLQPS